MADLTNEQINGRLRDFENPFLERKVDQDIRKDCLKTAVAFANSLPIGEPGILFVPVYDDGRIQEGQNLTKLQGTISELIGRAYPPIPFEFRLLGVEPAKFLAVLIRGSANRPHFGGPSYIRDGAQTRQASEDQFQALIASRNSKVYEILKSKGQKVSLIRWRLFRGQRVGGGPSEATVLDCDQKAVTLRLQDGNVISESMDRVTLNLDGKGRLLIEGEILI